MSSSAAQILAAAHAAAAAANDSPVAPAAVVAVSEEIPASQEEAPAAPAPGLNDDEAFPALGSAAVPSSVPTWGPKMSASSASSAVSSSAGSAFSVPPSSSSSFSTATSVKSVRMQSKAVQEAFTIKFDDQINLSKQEYASILNSLKKAYHCTIESTSSEKTKKRTFLITGEPKEINKVRREIVRRITKPIKLEFLIPENSRAMVIGSGGKNLKPIIEETGVKINIAHDVIPSSNAGDDEYVFENSVKVSIDGDFENATIAKQKILQIVNEHTKNLSTKLPVPEKIAPFIVQAIEFPIPADVKISLDEKTNDLCISGPREDVITVISKVRQSLLADDKLPARIVSKSFNVPKKLHRFIDTVAIKEKYNVVVNIPEAEEATNVEFIGESSKIEQALKFAKAESGKFIVESLNIAKAHGKNLEHAKNLAIMYKINDMLSDISEGSNVQVHTPSYQQILNATSAVSIDFAYSNDNEDQFKAIKKKVIDLTNKYNTSFLKLYTDIDLLFVNKAVETTKDLAISLNVQVIPFYRFDPKNNGILLFASGEDEDEDFGPTAEELAANFEKISKQWEPLLDLAASLETKTLIDAEITEKIQDKIDQGNFVQSLIDSCKSPLAIDLKTPSVDSITIRGTPSDVSHAVSEIQQFIEEAKNYEVASKYFTTLEFPTNQLSKLIGKNGEYVDALRDKYDVKIDTNNNAPASSEDKTVVKITGLKRNAEAAKVEISELGTKWADETTLTLKVPSQYARRLIGSSGSYVNRLKTKYNVIIKTPRELDAQNNESFIIRGPSKGAKKAHEELKELLQYEIDNGHKVTFEVPRSSISRIIGKGGARLTALRDEHGVEVDIEDNENDTNKSYITIVGSKSNISKVEKEIKAVADEVANTITMEIDVNPIHYSTIIGPSGSNLRAILAKAKAPEDANTRLLLVLPNRGDDSTIISSTGNKKVVESIIKQVKDIVSNAEKMVTETIEVPQQKHRLLIGTMGSVRHSIEEKFNVTLNIPRLKKDGSEPENTVAVKGLPEDIAKAKEHILELVSDKWADVVKVPVEYHGVLAGNNGQIFRKLRNDLNVKVEHGENIRQAKKLANESNISASGSIKDTEVPSGEKYVFITEKDPNAVTDASSLSGKVIEWRLIGDTKAVASAKKIIEDSLAAIKNYDTIGFIKVADRDSFRKVSGSKGATVNKISKESKCSVFIPRDIDDVNDVIVVRGSSEGVEKAKDAIVKLL